MSFVDFPLETESKSKKSENLFPQKHFEFFLPPRPNEEAYIRVYHIGEKVWVHTKKSKTKRGSDKFTPIRCSLRHDEQSRCVGCATHEKEPTINYANENRIVSVFDFRKIHEVPHASGKFNEKRTCSAPQECMYCNSGIDVKYMGPRHWLMGPTYYGILQHQHLTMGDTCVNCKTGKIISSGLKCKKCGESLMTSDAFNSMKTAQQKKMLFAPITCGSCEHEDTPEEIIRCTNNCDTPQRATIFDTNLKIEKIQAGQRTNLQITPTMQFEELPEEMKNVEAYTAEDIVPLFSLDVQAKLYNVKNPWGVSSEYVSNEEESKYFGG